MRLSNPIVIAEEVNLEAGAVILFNSYNFVFVFLPSVLLVVYVLAACGQLRMAIAATTVASVIFYGMHDWRFVPLLLASLSVNYALGQNIYMRHGSPQAGWLLALGLFLNLGALFVFKYTVFATTSVNGIFGLSIPVPAIVLPIGISFYTFTQIAYLVDCKRGHAHRYKFSDYALFVTFFPHLIAGPILKHIPFIAQLENGKYGRPSARRLYMGLVFFAVGLAKKVLIADKLSPFVGTVFDHAGSVGFAEGWLGALLYTFQLYYDFSGYSEMAVGLALFLNMRIPLNFNSPYKARSISDFWRRWHMSLSYFLKNYLYIGLGGNRVGALRHYFNLFITMLLGGIWHGAGWTFAVWGVLHGAYLVIHRLWQKMARPLPVALAWGITFIAVVSAWVFFRAKGVSDAWAMIFAMYGFRGFDLHFAYLGPYRNLMIESVIMILVALFSPNTQQFTIRRNPSVLLAILCGLLLLAGIISIGNPSEFIYFQF